jgi:nucleoside phosphorylase
VDLLFVWHYGCGQLEVLVIKPSLSKGDQCMIWNETLKRLNHLLAELYPSVNESYRIVDEAGLSKTRIAFQSRPIDNWYHILLDAYNQRKVSKIIECVLEDFPDHPELIKIKKEVINRNVEQDTNTNANIKVREKKEMTGKIDFAIITIRPDEHNAVLQRFPKEYIHKGKHRSYSVSRIPLKDEGSYLVAVVRSLDQGEGHAQDVARDIIEDLDPQWLLLVGIAGGVPAAEFTLGDVVVASKFTDFSVKAALEARTAQYAVGGGPLHKEVQDYLALLPAIKDELGAWNSRASIGTNKPPVDLTTATFYGDRDWQEKVRKSLMRHFGTSSLARPPLVIMGTIASSDTLVKDSQTVQQWQESARHIIAIEMELAGVYLAARRKDHEYPILAIRGISDIVGLDRHPDWTEFACQSAAALALAIVLTKPIRPKN